MRITILTLFPEYFTSILSISQLKRAQQKEKVSISLVNIRDFTHDAYHTVDDRPFGGGPGMVLKIEPIAEALDSLQLSKDKKVRILLLSARGSQFSQSLATQYAALDELVLICGHFSDVDQRVADHLVDQEIRVSNAVLTGGEPAAALVLDAVVRLLPGVLGNSENLQGESLQPDAMQALTTSAPAYTRPESFRGWTVPPVLLNGNHAEITDWKKQQQTKITDTEAT